VNLTKARVESMIPKRQTHRKSHTHHDSHSHKHAQTQTQSHAHHATHAHTHHAHSRHAFLFVKVYTCTYCGRQDHLANFCYDKLNESNSHIWVRKTNILGSKKVWLPKSAPTLHDIKTYQGSQM